MNMISIFEAAAAPVTFIAHQVATWGSYTVAVISANPVTAVIACIALAAIGTIAYLYRARESEWKAQQTAMQAQLETMKNQIESISDAKVAVVQKKLQDLEESADDKITSLTEELNTLKGKYIDFKDSNTDSEAKAAAVQKKLQDLEESADVKITSLTDELNTLKRAYKDFKDSNTKSEPSASDKKFSQNVLSKIADLTQNFEKLSLEKENLSAQSDKNHAILEQILADLEKVEKKNALEEQKVVLVEKTIEKLQNNCSDLTLKIKEALVALEVQKSGKADQGQFLKEAAKIKLLAERHKNFQISLEELGKKTDKDFENYKREDIEKGQEKNKILTEKITSACKATIASTQKLLLDEVNKVKSDLGDISTSLSITDKAIKLQKGNLEAQKAQLEAKIDDSVKGTHHLISNKIAHVQGITNAAIEVAKHAIEILDTKVKDVNVKYRSDLGILEERLKSSITEANNKVTFDCKSSAQKRFISMYEKTIKPLEEKVAKLSRKGDALSPIKEVVEPQTPEKTSLRKNSAGDLESKKEVLETPRLRKNSSPVKGEKIQALAPLTPIAPTQKTLAPSTPFAPTQKNAKGQENSPFVNKKLVEIQEKSKNLDDVTNFANTFTSPLSEKIRKPNDPIPFAQKYSAFITTKQ